MREQHGGPIGLGHVIVGPQVHGHDLVELAFRRGEHEDGHRAFAPDVAADGMPVGAGQLQIEHDAVGLGSEGACRGVAPGALVSRHGVAGKLQHVGQLRAQGGIVFDEINALGHGCLSFGGVRRCRSRRAWRSGIRPRREVRTWGSRARLGRGSVGARFVRSSATASIAAHCKPARRSRPQQLPTLRNRKLVTSFLGRRARLLDSKRMGRICLRS